MDQVLAPSLLSAFGSLMSQITMLATYPFSVGDNVNALRSATDDLVMKVMEINNKIRIARREGLTSRDQVNYWLGRANDVITEMQLFVQEYANRSDNCADSFPLNFCSNYSISRRAAEKLREVQNLINQIPNFEPVPATHVPASNSSQAINKMDAIGGPGGTVVDMDAEIGGVSRIKKMTVYHDSANVVTAISFTFERNGRSEQTEVWGGNRGGFKEIPLKENEYFTSVKGYYGKYKDWVVIKSLTFVSNLDNYGPYGCQEGTHFSLPAAGNDQIIGFHARSSTGYLDAIGTYVKVPS